MIESAPHELAERQPGHVRLGLEERVLILGEHDVRSLKRHTPMCTHVQLTVLCPL